MNLTKYVPDAVVFKASRALLQLQKSSPSTLFVVGIAGVAGTAILASRATLKTSDIIEDFNTPNFDAGWDPVEATPKEKTAVALRIVKTYIPTVAVGVLTIGALTGSHQILNNRNTALTAAYAALSDTYDRYRQRVAAEVGHEKEQAIRQDLVKKSFEEDGKTVKYKTASPHGVSVYAKFFDETCSSFSASAEQNLLFLNCQQEYANQRLRARGHLFLNEVYEQLGIPHTKAGAICGWVISKDGDNFVDFGLYDETNAARRAFVNGNEKAVLLDFNVDGVIFDLIEK